MKKFFNSSLWKDAIKTIKNSKSRFIAIIAMTGLSAAVFIGLQTGVPNLKSMIVNKTQEHNMHDLKVSSYTGIREKDKKILESISDFYFAEYFKSSTFDVINEQYSIKLYSKSKSIDTAIIKEGRLPEKENEIAIDYFHLRDHGSSLGEVITLEDKIEDDKKILNQNKFTIVGYVEHLEYIGNTRLGGSEGDYFAIVDENALNIEYPNYASIRLSSYDGKDFSSNSFKLEETDRVEKVRLLFENRPQEVKQEITETANGGIADARKELNQAKSEIDDAREELEDAKKELDDAKVEIEKGQKELDDSKIELEDARVKLEDGKVELNDAQEALSEAKNDLDNAKLELEEGKKKIEDGRIELLKNEDLLNDEMSKAYREIEDAQHKINAGFIEIKENEEKLKDSLKQYEDGVLEIASNKEKINNGLQEINKKEEELKIQKEDLNLKKQSLEQNLQSLVEGISNIESSIPEGVTREIALSMGNNEIVSLFDKLEELNTQKLALEEGLSEIIAGIQQIEVAIDQINSTREELNANLDTLVKEEENLAIAKVQIDQGRQEIEEARIELDNNQIKLDQSKLTLQNEEKSARQELANAKQSIEQSEKDYQIGLQKYNSGLEDYQDGLNKFNESKELYEDSVREFNDGEKKYQEGLKELEDAKAKYQDGLKEYEEGKIEFNDKVKEAEIEIADAEEEIKKAEDRIKTLNIPAYNVQGKYGNVSFYRYIDQANSLNLMSYIFSLLFYLVAILVTITTILRMVETERSQIGTLKALGYSKNKIMLKYLTYGILAAAIGSIIGVVIGRYILMPPVVSAYVADTNINDIPGIIEADKVVFIIAVTILLIAITTYLTVSKSLRENAANLMRPKAPKEAKRILLERVPFLWNRLSFLNKVSIRNLFRNKVRIIITIFGVAGSFGLIAMGFGIVTSIKNVVPKQFGEIYKFNGQIIYDKNADDFIELDNFIKENSQDYLSLIYKGGTVKTPDGFNEDITIMATDSKNFEDFILLRDRGNNSKFDIENRKVIISEKLAKNQKLKVGDNFIFKDDIGIEYSLPISAITEQYFNHAVYMSEETYKSIIDNKAEQNGYLLKLRNIDEKSLGNLRKQISNYEASNAFIPVIDLQDTLKEITESLNVVIFLVILVSALLALVVLYNLTDINISERTREISTIKVLGFRPKEVMSYIFKENIFLTILGMFVGVFAGKFMHKIIVFSLSPGAFQFDPEMVPKDFIYAVALTILFTFIVMILSKRNMDKINMVESLKSVE